MVGKFLDEQKPIGDNLFLTKKQSEQYYLTKKQPVHIHTLRSNLGEFSMT